MESPALHTDLYQLTMGCAYWREGRARDDAVFHLYFRRNPFAGGYTVACGSAAAIDYLREFRFSKTDLEYLATLRAGDDSTLFPPEFLSELSALRFSGDVHAVREGTVVFPREPLLRIEAPLLEAQLVETALLNIVNFETLIATKAARICAAASPQPVLEFGMRRAQGVDGALSASRAAYVGGCAGTSNVAAGRTFGIPVRGTHAHSWVMSFRSEREAFEAYARAMPSNCLLLVDTYDTIEGVKNAIAIGRQLASSGGALLGIRLDSGDLVELSRAARRLLDEAGFSSARVVASDDLDEHRIAELKAAGCAIDVWGVGTRLVTAFDQPALGGVYKLGALRSEGDGAWTYTMKMSSDAAKSSLPGVLQVSRRRGEDGRFSSDVIFDASSDVPATAEDDVLLEQMVRGGELLEPLPSIDAARSRAAEQLSALPDGLTRSRDPQEYDVDLDAGLVALVAECRAAGGRVRKS